MFKSAYSIASRIFPPVTLVLLCTAALSMPRASGTIARDWQQELRSRINFFQECPECLELLEGRPASNPDLAVKLQAAENIDTSAINYWRILFLGYLWDELQPQGVNPFYARLETIIASDPVKSWMAAGAFKKLGQHDKYASYLTSVHKTMLETGILRIPQFAQSYLLEARQAIESGQFETAETKLDMAGLFDPYCPWIPLLKVEIQLVRKFPWQWNLSRLWGNIHHALQRASHFENRFLIYLNISRAARLALTIFFTAVISVMLIRHFPRAAHSIAETIPLPVPLHLRLALLCIAGIGLILIGAGWMVMCLLAVFFLWFLLSKPEKYIAVAFCLYLFFLPLWLTTENRFARHLNPGSVYSLYYQASILGWDGGLVRNLNSLAPESRLETAIKNAALSLMHRKAGKPAMALEYAQNAADMAGTHYLVRHNLAAAHFLLGEYEKAGLIYQDMLRTGPDSPELLFNLSQVELHRNNSAAHSRYLESALVSNPAYVSEFIKHNDRYFMNRDNNSRQTWPPIRRLMEIPLQNPLSEGDGLFSEAWRVSPIFTSGAMSIPLAVISPVALLLALILSLAGSRSTLVTWRRNFYSCRLCRKTVCASCRLGAFCNDCYHTIQDINDEGLNAALVEHIQEKAKNRTAAARTVLNAVFPGAGKLYLGSGFPGLAVMTCTCALWAGNAVLFFPVKEYPNHTIALIKWLPVIPLLIPYFYYAAILVTRIAGLLPNLRKEN